MWRIKSRSRRSNVKESLVTVNVLVLIDKDKLMIYNKTELNIFEIGALRGLIGKLGVKPTRSRRCNGEQPAICHWKGDFLGRRRKR
jgi:hypothetical protein